MNDIVDKYRVVLDKLSKVESLEKVIQLLSGRLGVSEARTHMIISSPPRILLDNCEKSAADATCAVFQELGCSVYSEAIKSEPSCPLKIASSKFGIINEILARNREQGKETGLILVQGEVDKQGDPLPSMLGPFTSEVQQHFKEEDLVTGIDDHSLAILCHGIGADSIRRMADKTNHVYRQLFGGDMPLRIGYAIFPAEENNLFDLLRRAELRCRMENLAEIIAAGKETKASNTAAKALEHSNEDERKQQYKQKILGKLSQHQNLPTLPSVATRVLSIISSPNSSASEITEVIQHDAALTGKLLRVVNSAYYGFNNKVESIKSAVVILGMNEMTNLVCSLAAERVFTPKHIKGFYDLKALYTHSICTAWLSDYLDKQAGGRRGALMFTAGLLHDFGKLFLIEQFHEDYEKISVIAGDEAIMLAVAEEQVFGMSHADIGGELAKHWNLPQTLIEAIHFHHSPQLAPNYSEEAALVSYADALCRKLSTPDMNKDTVEADTAFINFIPVEHKKTLLKIFKCADEPAMESRIMPGATKAMEKAMSIARGATA